MVRVPLTTIALLLLSLRAPAANLSPPPTAPPTTALTHWPVHAMRALLIFPDLHGLIPPETQRLLDALSSPDFPTRDRASHELDTRGPAAFPGLKQAIAASPDLELAARTTSYFPAGSFDLPPHLPKPTITLVEQYQKQRTIFQQDMIAGVWTPADTLAALLQQQPGEESELFFELILPQETDPRARKELEAALHQRARLRARLAIAEGNLDDAEKILLDAQDLPGVLDDYLALRTLRTRGSFDLQQETAALPYYQSQPAFLQTLLSKFKGDLPAAADNALNLPEKYDGFARRILLEAGRFDDFATYIENSHVPLKLPDLALAAILTGNQAHADELLNRPLAAYANPDMKNYLPGVFARCDRAQDAITASQKIDDPHHTAFHLLCAQLRIREALATIHDRPNAPLDFPRHLSLLGLPAAAQSLLKGMQTTTHWPLDDQHTDAQYASQLAIAGLPNEAADARTGSLQFLQLLLTNFPAELHVADVVAATDFTDLDFPNPALAAEARFWYTSVLGQNPTDLRANDDKTRRLLTTTLPDPDLRALLPAILQSTATLPREAALYNLSFATTRFHLLHRDDLATDLISQFCTTHDDPTAYQLLGDLALDTNNPALALAHYQRAAIANLTDASLLYRLALALSQLPATRTQGEQLLAYTPYLVLADDDQALRLFHTIEHFDGPANAATWFEPYARRFLPCHADLWQTAITIARDAAESRHDFPTAVALQKKLLLAPPPPPSPYLPAEAANMLNLATYHRLRALDALARHDLPTLADALARTLDNGPPNIPLLTTTLPTLRSTNPAAAHQILSRAIARLQPLVTDYPTATPYPHQLQSLLSLKHPP